MKTCHNLFFALLLLLVTGINNACDNIEPPYMTHQEPVNDNDETARKLLLEVFTGHRCPNCPEGSKQARILQDFYQDQLVVITIHAGWYANSTAEPFNYDFTTSEGDAINKHFGIEFYPNGMVNRQNFEGSKALAPGSWGSALHVLADMEPGFSINLSTFEAQSANTFNLDVNLRGLDTPADNGEYLLVAMLTEDQIIRPQRTNDPEYPDGYIPDYEHNHVLRKGITHVWGESMGNEDLWGTDPVNKSYSFSLDDDWNAENCNVVVYVMNNQMEVKQVESLPLIP